MSKLKFIHEDDCLFDVDEGAWRRLVEYRGGCSCHLSPPCRACGEPETEDELNRVGYTMLSGIDILRNWRISLDAIGVQYDKKLLARCERILE